jgi:hypothetical protein
MFAPGLAQLSTAQERTRRWRLRVVLAAVALAAAADVLLLGSARVVGNVVLSTFR